MLKGTASLPSLSPAPQAGSPKKKVNKKIYSSKSSADFTPLPALKRKVKKTKVKLPRLDGKDAIPGSPSLSRSRKVKTNKIRARNEHTSKKNVSQLTQIGGSVGLDNRPERQKGNQEVGIIVSNTSYLKVY